MWNAKYIRTMLIMDWRSVMARRRRFSEEYQPEPVAPASQLGVTKDRVGRELGVILNLLTR